MYRYSKTLVQISAILMALTATPKLLSVSLFGDAVLAQSSSEVVFPLPESLPNGTTIKVDGSSSMRVINQALKQRFEEKFPNSQIELSAAGSDQAIDALLNGEVDIVAIGRPLTPEEKAAGLVAVSVDRPKIAIIVSPDNSFDGNLTFEEFARIFRGEITDWSEVGGEPGPIRFVDRPNFSDTRRSLGTYEVFKSAPFETGTTATPVLEDETAAVIQQLGNDGISYAIVDQVTDQPGVRIIPMHQTLPDNPAYPYSQPRNYVYRGGNTPEPGTAAFLGFATSEPGQEVVAQAKEEEAEAVSAAIATAPGSDVDSPTAGDAVTPGTTPDGDSPTAGDAVTPGTTADGGAASNSPSETAQVPPVATDEEDATGGFPWWLLLFGIPLLGGLIWKLRGRDNEPVAGGTAGTVGTDIPTSGGTGTPTTPNIEAGGVAAPGVDVTPTTPNIEAGGVAAPGVDVTPTTPNIEAGGVAAPGVDVTPTTPNIEAGGVAAPGVDVTPTTPNIEAGGVAAPGVDVTPTTPTTPGISGGTPGINLPTPPLWAGLIGIPAILAWLGRPSDSRITLTPGSHQNGSAYWNVPEADKNAAKQEGGQHYQLRIYDVTDINVETEEPHNVQVYDCSESEREYQMPLEGGHEYLAEIGYLTNDGRWLGLASSNRILIPAEEEIEPVITGLDEGITDLESEVAPRMNGTVDTVTPEPVNLTDEGEITDAPEPVNQIDEGEVAEDVVEPVVIDEETIDPVESTQPQTSAMDEGETEDEGEPRRPLWSIPILDGRVGIIGGAIAALGSSSSQITLTPESGQNALASWEVPQADKDAAKQQGGQQYQVRIYDVTDIDLDVDPPHSVQPYGCNESTEQLQVSLDSGREYLAEIGYLTDDNQWLILARSTPVLTDAEVVEEGTEPVITDEGTTTDVGVQPSETDAIEEGTEPVITDEGTTTDVGVQPSETDAIEEGTEPVITDEGTTTDVGVQPLETDAVEEVENETQSRTPFWRIPLIGGGVGLIGGLLSTPPSTSSEISLTPQSGENAMANWQVSQADKDAAKQQGGQQYQVRIYDVTDIDLDVDPPHSVQPYGCNESTEQLQVSLDSGREYLAEIGYLTDDNQWLILARSTPVLTDAEVVEEGTEPVITDEGTTTDVGVQPSETDAIEEGTEPVITDEGTTTDVGVQPLETDAVEEVENETQSPTLFWRIPLIGGGVGLIGGLLSTPPSTSSEISLTPQSGENALASWEVPQVDKDAAKQQGGQQYQLRIYDVTDIDLDIDAPHSVQPYDCNELTQQLQVSLAENRYYIAEIGYLTNESQWLMLARSHPVLIGESEATEGMSQPVTIADVGVQPSEIDAVEDVENETQSRTPFWRIPLIGGGVGLIGGLLSTPPSTSSEISLTPQSGENALASWEVPQADKDAAKQQGGQQYQLRIYDVTDIDLDIDAPHSVQPYDCNELTQQLQVSLAENRYYIAEIGYLTNESQWLMLARSHPVLIGESEATEGMSQPVTTADVGVQPSEIDAVEDGVEPVTTDEGTTTDVGVHPSEIDGVEPVTTDEGTTAAVGVHPSETDAVEDGVEPVTTDEGTTDVESIHSEIPPTNALEEVKDADQQQELEKFSPTGEALIPGGGTMALLTRPLGSTQSHIELTSAKNQSANVFWEVPQADKDAAKQQGGQQYQLRIYDVTDIDIAVEAPHSVEPYDCHELTQQLQISLENNRYYIAEIGYLTSESQWLVLARSNPTLMGEVEAVETLLPLSLTPPMPLTSSSLTLSPGDGQNVYVSCEVPQVDKDAAKQRGGQQYQLRMYDITGIDFDTEVPHSVQPYECEESDQMWQLPIESGNRQYLVEIGYATADGQWLMLARSNAVLIPETDLENNGIDRENDSASQTGNQPEGGVAISRVTRGDCAIQHLTVHSRNNCYILNDERMKQLQEVAVSKTLEPGIHVVRIKSGAFCYGSNLTPSGEPFVMLWIHGGPVINKKTNVPVTATWSSLNGYNETLTLKVLETATLCAFFFDSYPDDNEGELTLSVARLYTD